MKTNYFKIHKNKKPKKIKYSKPYTKKQLEKIENLIEFFNKEIEKIKLKKMKNLKIFLTIFFGLLIAELIVFLFVAGMVSFANWELLELPEFNAQTFKNIRTILACNLFGTIVYFPFFKFFGNLTK